MAMSIDSSFPVGTPQSSRGGHTAARTHSGRFLPGRFDRGGVEGRIPMSTRASTRSTKAKKAKTARHTRKPAPRRPRWGAGMWLRLPMLEQRELDLAGLALVAAGVVLGFVLYTH